MTLRNKMLLLITGMLCGLIVLLYLGSTSILQESLDDAEQRIARQSVAGALGVIRAQGTRLKNEVADWKTPERQLPTGSLVNFLTPSSALLAEGALLDLKFLIFTDSSAKILWTRNYDTSRPLKTSFFKPFADLALLKKIAATRDLNMLKLEDGTAFVTARPIANGKYWIVAGRDFSGQAIAQLAAASDLPFSAEPIDDALSETTSDIVQQLQSKLEMSSIEVRPMDKTRLAAYALVRGADGEPVLLVGSSIPRTVSQNGRALSRTFGGALLLAGFFIVAVTALLLERLVLTRLDRLSTDVRGISENVNLARRVEAQGDDELSHVGQAVNALMDGLERSERGRALAAEQGLRARQEAEEANRAKSQFLANMSHELRTPLNAIIGYSEMLQEEAEDAGQDDFIPDLQKINTAGKQLLALINDVLDLSKIEAGKMELFLESFDAGALLTAVCDIIKPAIAKNQNRLVVEIAEDLGTMHADLTKVRQSLINLLSNASKFTENGIITVQARPEGDEILFSVSDTGIGMTPQQLGKLYQAFSQADISTQKKYGGTGLGLIITKKFCQMMGGDVLVESEVGQGTTFTLRLPRHAIDPKTRAIESVEEEKTAPQSLKLLVLDEDPEVAEIIRRAIVEDFDVATAGNGEDGLKIARQLRPDVILLSTHLENNADGYEVLKQLKADEKIAKIPVVMLALTEEKSMAFALGAADFLVKPINRKRLSSVVRKVLREKSGGKRGAHRVLIADDDQTTRSMMRRILENDAWEVIEAANGKEALELMENATPVLIVMDLKMPEMDGFALIHAIRARDEWKSLPIVVITAMDIGLEDGQRLRRQVQRVVQKGAVNNDDLMVEIRYVAAAAARQLEEAS